MSIGEIADRGDAEARRLQRAVELAVLDQLDRFREGQVLGLAQIVVAHLHRAEDGAGVELGARSRRADRQALALELFEAGDAALGGSDDLDVVGIDRGDAADLVERRGEARIRVAFPGHRHRVTEREGQLAAPVLQQVHVLDARLGRLHLRARAFDVLAIDVREADAERVVDARGAARQHVDELLRVCGQRRGHERGARRRPLENGGDGHEFLPLRRLSPAAVPVASLPQRQRSGKMRGQVS